MSRILILLFACLCSLGAFGAAESTGRPQHNFLFVVDTSISMADHKSAAASLVRATIESGFAGQIETGDSVDIWTYDSENHIARFPPQIWEEAEARRIAGRAGLFLEREKFRGRSRFAAVAADLNALLPHPDGLLVVIVTDGDEPVAGINFDIEINERIAEIKRERTVRQPFLISLAAHFGRFIDWQVSTGGGDVHLATLPARPRLEPVMVQAPSEPAPQPGAETIGEPESHIEPELEPPPVIVDYPPGAKVVATIPPPAPQAVAALEEVEPFALEAFTEASVESAAEPAPPVPEANIAEAKTDKPQAEREISRKEVAAAPATVASITSAGVTATKELTPPSPRASQKFAPESNAISPVVILMAGGGTFICLAAGSLLMMRKSRHRAQPSIISKSLAR